MAIARPPAPVDDLGSIQVDDDGDERNVDPDGAQPCSRDVERKGLSDSALFFFNESPQIRAYHRFGKLCGDVINNSKVQLVIIALIMVNAIMMGVATFDFVTENPDVASVFDKLDNAFLVIFTVELLMQFAFMGFNIFRDGWLVFDFLIIVLSWSLTRVQIIRAFRIFRALRIITRIKTMRNLVTALFDVMPRLGSITMLLLLIFYIFAVLFTTLFGGLDLPESYFSRLDHSLMTLFVFMTMEWADVAREVMAMAWWAWAPCIVFVVVTGFIVFNLIIAVVCDAVAVVEKKNHDLEPDFFQGAFGGDAGAEEPATFEDEMERLATRIAGVLRTQNAMTATLEALAQDSLLALKPPPPREAAAAPPRPWPEERSTQ